MIFGDWEEDHPFDDFTVLLWRTQNEYEDFQKIVTRMTSRLDSDTLKWTEQEDNTDNYNAGYICRKPVTIGS